MNAASLLLRFWPYILIVVMGASLYVMWNRLDAVTEQRDQAEANYEAEKRNVKIVEKLVEVKVAAAAAVPHIRRSLDRVCVIPPVADTGQPDEAAVAKARDVFLDSIAGEISECLSEGEGIVAARAAARNAGCLK